MVKRRICLVCGLGVLAVAAVLAACAGLLQAQSAPPTAQRSASSDVLSVHPTPVDVAKPPGLPAIGKWMIDRDGSIAHWLGEIYDGKALREPINVILVDTAAASAEEAKQRLMAAATAAGYPVRFGHSAGYRGLIGDDLYAQLPQGRDDAFSDGIFELSNNHGRIFGPHRAGDAYISIAAFSREEVRPFRWPEHGYASFNRAREDFAQRLDRGTAFKLQGFVNLENAISDDRRISTGDHDGRAVVVRAEK